MYGAKRGKILNMFIDDLSLPQRDQCGTQEVNEVSLTLHLFPLDPIFATEMRLEYTVRQKKNICGMSIFCVFANKVLRPAMYQISARN